LVGVDQLESAALELGRGAHRPADRVLERDEVDHRLRQLLGDPLALVEVVGRERGDGELALGEADEVAAEDHVAVAIGDRLEEVVVEVVLARAEQAVAEDHHRQRHRSRSRRTWG
jgi:hypothetical protein